MSTLPVLRRYFLDTEFYPADGHSHLISIGLVGEHDKGPGIYAIDRAFSAAACRHAWINTHVIAKLDDTTPRLTKKEMADAIIDYIQPAQRFEFWARNGSYDFYHLCQIFGDMGDLYARTKNERGAKYTDFRDIDEVRRAAGHVRLPKQPEEQAHIAINDARWDRDQFAEIERLAAVARARPKALFSAVINGIKATLKGPQL